MFCSHLSGDEYGYIFCPMWGDFAALSGNKTDVFCVILATEVIILNQDNWTYCCLLYCDSSYFIGNNTVHSNSNHYTLLTLTKWFHSLVRAYIWNVGIQNLGFADTSQHLLWRSGLICVTTAPGSPFNAPDCKPWLKNSINPTFVLW